MFDVFGEFDSFEEINKTAAGLLEEGDIENLGVLAKENGIDSEDLEAYLSGDFKELTSPLGAALGKLKIEKEEADNILVDDIADYLMANCDDERLAINIRKNGKRTIKAAGLVADEAKKHKISMKSGTCHYCGPMKGFQIIRDYYMED